MGYGCSSLSAARPNRTAPRQLDRDRPPGGRKVGERFQGAAERLAIGGLERRSAGSDMGERLLSLDLTPRRQAVEAKRPSSGDHLRGPRSFEVRESCVDLLDALMAS
jgi:hypothetical protein